MKKNIILLFKISTTTKLIFSINVPANIQMETYESKGRSVDFPDSVSDLEQVSGFGPGVMS